MSLVSPFLEHGVYYSSSVRVSYIIIRLLDHIAETTHVDAVYCYVSFFKLEISLRGRA